jgi:hypothetical protein
LAKPHDIPRRNLDGIRGKINLNNLSGPKLQILAPEGIGRSLIKCWQFNFKAQILCKNFYYYFSHFILADFLTFGSFSYGVLNNFLNNDECNAIRVS